MKTLIVYTSHHGTTKHVAELISAELQDSAICDVSEFSEKLFDECDQIVVGTPIYAGKPPKKLTSFIEKYGKRLLEKPLGLFVCGMIPDEASKQTELETAFPEALRAHATVCSFMGGALHFSELNFLEKSIMKLVMHSSQDQDTIDPERVRAFAQKMN